MADPGGVIHSETYRRQILGPSGQRSEEDRPLVVQLGGADPLLVAEAASVVVGVGKVGLVRPVCLACG